MRRLKANIVEKKVRVSNALPAFAIGLGLQTPVMAEPYSITDLGTLGGHTQPWDVNDSGQVVGFSVNSQGISRAFLYQNGQIQDLGTLGGGNGSVAYSINNDGQIVGQADAVSSLPLPSSAAFLYRNGQMQNIGAINGFPGDISAATGINGVGNIVGWQGPISGGLFFYSNGIKRFLGVRDVLGHRLSINSQDQIAGTVASMAGGNHAFLYANNQMKDLGTLGGTESRALSINNSGQVVGYSYVNPSVATAHAFLYESGQMKNLGTLEGLWTEAQDINDSGQIVGWGESISSGGSRAFLYSNGRMLDLNLNGLLPQNSGWLLYHARAINNTGLIVGDGAHNGNPRAFLLKPQLQVDAGPDQTVNEGVQVHLTGAAIETYCVPSSSSPCPRYQWQQTSGTVVSLSGADTDRPSFAAPSLSSVDQELLTFKLTVTDSLANTNEDSVSVTINDVVDVTPPLITSHIQGLLGQAGWYVSDVTVSWDVTDPESAINYKVGCGETRIIADTVSETSSCEAGSAGGRSSQSASVKRDTVPPAIQMLSPVSVEATSGSGAVVDFNPSVTDAISKVQAVTCMPSSGSLFPLGTTSVTCKASDNAGNFSDSVPFNVSVVDTKPPAISCPANVSTLGGLPVNLGVPTVTDWVDVSPSVTNDAPGSFALGVTTVTWTATDDSGNSVSCEQTVTVTARTTYSFNGFFQPLDNPPIVNTVKSGSTVPVKYRLVDAAGNYFTDIATLVEAKYVTSICGGIEDLVEETVATGATKLRWDDTSHQFIYNWKTPTLPGKCVRLDLRFNNGIVQSAFLKLK